MPCFAGGVKGEPPAPKHEAAAPPCREAAAPQECAARRDAHKGALVGGPVGRKLLGMTKGSRSKGSTTHPPRGRRWSQAVTEHSHALDLEEGVFSRSPLAIARSLQRSAGQSRRRKGSPFRSAMSMITFYENRAGRKLPPSRRGALEQAKVELRRLFGRAGKRRAKG
jgi:hypothetical protein